MLSLVPRAGIEPVQPQGPRDFKSQLRRQSVTFYDGHYFFAYFLSFIYIP